MTPELVRCCHSTSPVRASKALKYRSLVPPAKTSPPPVVSTGPQFWESNSCVHTRSPAFRSQACSSPMWSAPGARVIAVSAPVNRRPGTYSISSPTLVPQRFSLAGM